jgi:hypothetical protein
LFGYETKEIDRKPINKKKKEIDRNNGVKKKFGHTI